MKKIDELDQKTAQQNEELTVEQKIETAKSILVSLEKIKSITEKDPDHPDEPKK